jgi:hypothetical protein
VHVVHEPIKPYRPRVAGDLRARRLEPSRGTQGDRVLVGTVWLAGIRLGLAQLTPGLIDVAQVAVVAGHDFLFTQQLVDFSCLAVHDLDLIEISTYPVVEFAQVAVCLGEQRSIVSRLAGESEQELESAGDDGYSFETGVKLQEAAMRWNYIVGHRNRWMSRPPTRNDMAQRVTKSLRELGVRTSHLKKLASGDLAGKVPLEVSADNITASVPSSTAFATSEASARVGEGFRVMDSSIWVAVMTGFRW